ncbi:LamG domain-containing protein, partial [Arthrospira platensis SPKY2]
INGYCWFETGSGGEVLSAVDLHNLIESKDRNVEQIRNQLSGEYSVVHIYDNGNILAFNDNLGIEHIYYSEAPNQYIITNRVSLIDVIQPKYSYDYLGMLWMQTIGYLIGEHTYRQDVRSLSQGGSLKITQGGLHLLENPHWLFPEGTIDNRGWKHISDFQIETAIESAMANVNILSRKNQDILELGITGGKDSRVVLALCLAAGMKDKLRLYTNGNPNHPDSIVGKMIAEKLEIPHEQRDNISNNCIQPVFSASEIFNRLAVHTFQNDGMLGAWDLPAVYKASGGITIMGLVAEVLKGYIKKPFSFDSFPKPSTLIQQHGPFDSLGILKPETKAYLENELSDSWSSFLLSSSMTLNDLPDIFYLRERIPNWVGASRRVTSYTSQVINPLNSPCLIKTALCLSPRERQIELLHYFILNKINPVLTKIPFAFEGWNIDLKMYGASDDIFTEPITSHQNIPRHGSWQYSLNKNPQLRYLFIDIIDSCKLGEFEKHLDLYKVQKKLAKDNFTFRELICFLGLLPPILKLNNYIIPRKILPYDISSPYHRPVCLKENNYDKYYIYNGVTKTRCIGSNEPTNKLIGLNKPTNAIKVAGKVLDLIPAMTFEAYLHPILGNKVKGWAWCPQFPNIPVTIELINEEKVIAKLVADIFHNNLLRGGKGNGHHAFEVDLPILSENLGNYRNIHLKILDSDLRIANPVIASRDFKPESPAYVKIPHSESVSIVGDLTITFWLYLRKWPCDWTDIISKYVSDSQNEFCFRLKNEDRGQFYYGDGNKAVPTVNFVPKHDMNLNEWTHIACVRKLGEYGRIYFNGLLLRERDWNGYPKAITTQAPVVLMASPSWNRFHNGKIGNLRMWCVAKSTEDILNDMRKEVAEVEEELLAYYPCNGSSEISYRKTYS